MRVGLKEECDPHAITLLVKGLLALGMELLSWQSCEALSTHP